MAITLSTAARNAACNAIVDLIDVSTPGKLVIQTAGSVTVATLTFAATAFGNAATGVATAAAIVSDTNAVGGTAAKFKITDGAAAEVLNGTVATSGADLNLSSLAIGAGDTVSVSSFTVTVPAS